MSAALSRAAGRVTEVAVPLVALAIAAVLVAAGAPVVVRTLVALPVVTLVAGSSLVRLLLGAPWVAVDEPDAVDDPGGTVGTARDGLVRTLLAVVLGILALLASLLVTQAMGIPIADQSVLVGTLVAALGLLLLSRIRAGTASPGPAPGVRRRLRTVLAVAAAAVLLGSSVAFATTLTPRTTERYALLSFDQPARYGPDPLSTTRLARVELDVSLASYGQALPDASPTTRLTVSGAEASRLRSTWAAPTAGEVATGSDTVPGAQQRRTGRISFVAPADPGLYALDLEVGGPSADPLRLTAYLVVS